MKKVRSDKHDPGEALADLGLFTLHAGQGMIGTELEAPE